MSVRALALDRASDGARNGDPSLLHQCILLGAFTLATILNDQRPGCTHSWSGWLGIGNEEDIERECRANAALNLYIDLCIPEEPIQGNWPAVEGIRIVRERRETGEMGE